MPPRAVGCNRWLGTHSYDSVVAERPFDIVRPFGPMRVNAKALGDVNIRVAVVEEENL
jgi:hypothetical protein